MACDKAEERMPHEGGGSRLLGWCFRARSILFSDLQLDYKAHPIKHHSPLFLSTTGFILESIAGIVELSIDFIKLSLASLCRGCSLKQDPLTAFWKGKSSGQVRGPVWSQHLCGDEQMICASWFVKAASGELIYRGRVSLEQRCLLQAFSQSSFPFAWWVSSWFHFCILKMSTVLSFLEIGRRRGFGHRFCFWS